MSQRRRQVLSPLIKGCQQKMKSSIRTSRHFTTPSRCASRLRIMRICPQSSTSMRIHSVRSTGRCCTEERSWNVYLSAVNKSYVSAGLGKCGEGNTPSGPTPTHFPFHQRNIILPNSCLPPCLSTTSRDTLPFVRSRNHFSLFAYPAFISVPARHQGVAWSLLTLSNEVGRTDVRGSTESKRVASS